MAKKPHKKAAADSDHRYGDGRAAFLGHLDAIQVWIDAGRTLRSYYDQHQDQLVITYSTFVRHGRKLLNQPTRIPDRGHENETPTPAPETERQPKQAAVPAGPVQFQHTPDSSLKDLV